MSGRHRRPTAIRAETPAVRRVSLREAAEIIRPTRRRCAATTSAARTCRDCPAPTTSLRRATPTSWQAHTPTASPSLDSEPRRSVVQLLRDGRPAADPGPGRAGSTRSPRPAARQRLGGRAGIGPMRPGSSPAGRRNQLGVSTSDVTAKDRVGRLPAVRDRRAHWWFDPDHLARPGSRAGTENGRGCGEHANTAKESLSLRSQPSNTSLRR